MIRKSVTHVLKYLVMFHITMNFDSNNKESNAYGWIEILLNMGIRDGRHRMISNVLAPYLINIKGLEVSEAEEVIMRWVDQCERYEPVKGNVGAFIKRACITAYRLGKKPHDLQYLKTKHGNIYSEIASLAEAYQIQLDEKL